MPHLFEPLKIKDITLRNRIGVSPMCQYSSVNGLANDWQLTHLGARAAGGAALVITEATAVEARGRISPFDVGLWCDEQVEPLARLAHFIRQQGAVPAIQLAHAGRKANTHRPWDGGAPLVPGETDFWQVIGPSPLAFAPNYQVPLEMDFENIHNVQTAFLRAAERALAAGFEWLELHAGHGYLIHSFYSPLSNQRQDAYGGDFYHRIHFLIETLQEIRSVWPERLPLAVRISGTDWCDEGWQVQDSVELAKILKSEGVDLVDCSSGGNLPSAHIPAGPGYQVPIAETLRREAGIQTAAVGLITSPTQADEIICKEQADLVLLGRELLRNPTWPIQAARDLNHPMPIPPQYLRAY